MKIDVINQNKEKVEVIDLDEKFWGIKWMPDLVHQVLVSILSNKRYPWAHTKDRSEVSGGGKKPWRQKGTGRARHGSIRSPLWKGGGVTFGPRNEKKYSKKINKKVFTKALFSVLSKKLADKELLVIDNLNIEDTKTKLANKIIKNLFLNNKQQKKEKVSAVFVVNSDNNKFLKAAKNIKGVKTIKPQSLDLYEILSHHYIVFEKNAVETLKDIYKNI
ncbi:MAG: 50S ribosomal protein L4 [Minisyncoccia bacterium]